MEYQGQPGIPIRVIPIKSFRHPDQWCLYSKSEGASYGKLRDIFEEASQAADKENKRHFDYWEAMNPEANKMFLGGRLS